MSEIAVAVGDKKKVVEIINEGLVDLSNKTHKVNLTKLSDYLYLLKIDEKIYEVTTTRFDKEKYLFVIDGRQIYATGRTALQEKAHELLKQRQSDSKEDSVKAPMPGLILKILKKEGEQVNLGDPLIVLEAMKMENEIRSPASGLVSKVHFSEGQSVEKDTAILDIE